MNASFELTPTELEVLEYEAEAESMTVNAMVRWMVRENIPSLLDVIEKDGRRDELMRKLVEEKER